MSSILVSILIPVYNREDFISQTINSALEQTYKNIEIIIVDNCSTDNTWKIVQSFASKDSRIKAYRNNSNIGPVRNWKECINIANGEIGKILWSDDLISPRFLEHTVPMLKSDIGFVFSKVNIFSDSINQGEVKFNLGQTGIYNTENYIKGIFSYDDLPLSPGCAIFHMKSLRDNLLLDVPNSIHSDFTMHAIGNDLLLFLLTAHKFENFGFIDETLSHFRSHSKSISTSTDKSKLTFYYHLAKIYFAEEYRPDLIRIENSQLFFHMLMHKYYKQKGIKRIKDFYTKNKDEKITVKLLLKLILERFKVAF
ncbi:glycosyltransferase family 2 protein [Endozoicomonas atrinae]|uniref:glycosyltransferase family 2 protein n=1 Tax=Endozoicomonas atrinae TaxID=1333660 RepID=UPI003AFFE9E4